MFLELLHAVFKIAHIFDRGLRKNANVSIRTLYNLRETYLKDGQLVHFSRAGRNQTLEYRKLLIHL